MSLTFTKEKRIGHAVMGPLFRYKIAGTEAHLFVSSPHGSLPQEGQIGTVFELWSHELLSLTSSKWAWIQGREVSNLSSTLWGMTWGGDAMVLEVMSKISLFR